MATNEHNPSFGNLLTAMSGSTINIVSEIDSAITDIQNYIDSAKTDIDSAITTSQNNIYSHISGSTISIDNFIDSAITTINANVDSKTSMITTIKNSILGSGDTIVGIPNLNVGSKFTERRCTTSGTETTLFSFSSPGYLWVQAYNDSSTATAEVSIYRIASGVPSNLISKTYIQPQSSEICACFPALCDEDCFITAKSDGSSSVCVIAQLYTTVAGTETELNISDHTQISQGTPTTNNRLETGFNVLRATTSSDVRSILKFDLSSIDPSASILSVELDLWSMYALNQTDFNIGLTDEDVTLVNCTWNDRQSGVPWTVAGDGGNSLNPTPIWTGNLVCAAGDHLTFDVTESVKSWINGSITNNGFIFYYYPGLHSSTRFGSYYNSTPNNRPKLIVTII
ncbi:MAG: DNRLRE domain-containing protein [Veillonellaceae bacterium]|nr:DNRLRE domain-containing protein [Veillonellaceae bacterium]